MVKYDPQIHHRRSVRLRGYDYRQAGAYFVTICVQGRECLFGNIENSEIELNQYGKVVDEIWHRIPQHFSNVDIDSAIVMPNHFHGIVVICDVPANVQKTDPRKIQNGETPGIQGGETPPLRSKCGTPTLGQIVGYFKYQTTKKINQIREMAGVKIWQRNYYEHVIRDEILLGKICEYVVHNPQTWDSDQLHPNNPSKW